MSNGPQIFRIDPNSQESKGLEEVEFAELGFREREDIQEWISNNPGILGEGLLVIGKEFSDFRGARERPDLLAVDTDGKLVVIELKRDDSGADVHWQAIRYASYFSHATAEDIVGIFARYKGILEPDAQTELVQHLNVANAEDLNATLNHDQRIILASHRFAAEVKTAVLWLNREATNESLITCVQLTPYRDEKADSLYLLASIIIPVPGIDVVGIGKREQAARGRNPDADDGVTHFVREVAKLAIDGLPDKISPDRRNRWALSWTDKDGRDHRYYSLSYSRVPWGEISGDNGTYYQVFLTPEDAADQVEGWNASVFFRHNRKNPGQVAFGFQDILGGIGPLHEEWQVVDNPDMIQVHLGTDTLSEDFARKIANVLRRLIETITPVVDRLAKESG